MDQRQGAPPTKTRASYGLVEKGVRMNVRNSGDQRSGTRNLSKRQLQTLAREVATSLPGVSHGRPFVEKLDVYKVGNRVFMIVTDDPDERIITLKADPDHASALRDHFQMVTFGRYLDKGHWISISAGRGITSQLITELVKTSYQLVVEMMLVRDRPKKDRA
jgi:predicted DNA-binding protein (MmcQ/YjbR family)